MESIDEDTNELFFRHRLFEKHKIDDLPVVDAQGALVGCVDIQDLPKMKVL